MKYLFDTNAVIALLKGHQGILERLYMHGPDDFGMPSIVAHELFYGAYKSTRVTDNVARVMGLRFEVLPFDREDAEHAGELRAFLAGEGTPIGPYDALIAGQARARNLILITNNMREFARVPSLEAEDWESPPASPPAGGSAGGSATGAARAPAGTPG